MKDAKFLKRIDKEFIYFLVYKYNRKITYDVLVKNIKTNEILGDIRWDTGWRRYIFEPRGWKMFDSKCLKDITGYIDELMEERKNEKNIS